MKTLQRERRQKVDFYPKPRASTFVKALNPSSTSLFPRFPPDDDEFRISVVKTRAHNQQKESHEKWKWIHCENFIWCAHMCDCRRRRQRGEIVGNLLDFFDIVLAACFIESSANLVVFNGRFSKSILWDREKEPRGKLFLKHLTQFSPQQKLEKKIEFEFQQFCCY